MTILPKSLSYRKFLDMVGNIPTSTATGIPVQYNDLYNLVIERLGDKPIENYTAFLANCGALGDLFYWDLYVKLYPENEDVADKKKANQKGGTRRRRRKSKNARRTRR